MNKQSQNADQGSIAVQAGGSVSIGMTAEQMRQIMQSFNEMAIKFQAQATEIADRRISSFQENLIERFATDKKAKAAAFGDPDFQYVLWQAQAQVARSSETATMDMLIDLLVQRSKETARTRLALSLDVAVERAPLLTSDELSAITWCFVVGYTHNQTVRCFADLVRHITETMLPFADISSSATSYQHIEAVGCGYIQPPALGGQSHLMARLRNSFPDAFSRGFTKDELHALLPDGKKDLLDFLTDRIEEGSELLCFRLPRAALEAAMKVALPDVSCDSLWKPLVEQKRVDDTEALAKFRCCDPELEPIFRRWDDSQIKYLHLNNVGIAIAMANVNGKGVLELPPDRWIT